jgi:small conductance mechanosensitive channel
MHLSRPLFNLLDELGISSAVATTWVSRLVGLIIVWTTVWMLVRYLSRWIARMDDHVKTLKISARDMKTLDRVLDYITILIGLIVSLAILDWTSLLYSALTAAGLFSVVIGLAVRDVAANFVAGVFIIIDRPFVIGDFIKAGGHSGTVQQITLRSTAIVTPQGPVVHIPNSVLSGGATVNYTVPRVRPISFTLSVAGDADVNQALKSIKKTLAGVEGLLAERTQLVLVDDARASALNVSVSCYASADVWPALSSHLQQQVRAALQQAGIELVV